MDVFIEDVQMEVLQWYVMLNFMYNIWYFGKKQGVMGGIFCIYGMGFWFGFWGYLYCVFYSMFCVYNNWV